MSEQAQHPIAIHHEHPDWFRPLFAELDRRGLPWERVDARTYFHDPSAAPPAWALFFNRMSPSAWRRDAGHAISYTLQLLDHLERAGVPVLNGAEAFRTEISKARQISLLASLGLEHPRSRVIHHASQAVGAAEGLRWPLVLKPNIGGSGAGIRRFAGAGELATAVADGSLDLGLDSTALVQEFLPAESGRIVRVETLGGRYLYGIRVYTSGDDFNLCPADICRDASGGELVRGACAVGAPSNGIRVEGFTPPDDVVRDVERIVNAAGLDIGGVEYLIDSRTGRPVYYDINALSNFVADAPRVIGFDPFVNLVDWLEEEAGWRGTPAATRHAASA
jgi:hypothetical protein